MTRPHEQQVAACYATWGERYHREYYEQASYPPMQVPLIRGELQRAQPRDLLDAGCGPASMLREIADLPIELYGFDLTPEMVASGREVMQRVGRDPQRLWTGSVLERSAFHAPDGKQCYDAVLCCGVLPHLRPEEENLCFANIRAALEPGGIALIEARNELFALFTFNRYTAALLGERLMELDGLRARHPEQAPALDAIQKGIEQQLRMELPPVRKGYEGEPGYDEVLSRLHNPLELAARFQRGPWREVEVLYYHYHAFPPMFSALAPELFREESLRLEEPRDWRGTVMASAFVLKAIAV